MWTQFFIMEKCISFCGQLAVVLTRISNGTRDIFTSVRFDKETYCQKSCQGAVFVGNWFVRPHFNAYSPCWCCKLPTLGFYHQGFSIIISGFIYCPSNGTFLHFSVLLQKRMSVEKYVFEQNLPSAPTWHLLFIYLFILDKSLWHSGRCSMHTMVTSRLWVRVMLILRKSCLGFFVITEEIRGWF